MDMNLGGIIMKFEIYRCFEAEGICYLNLSEAKEMGNGTVIREKVCAFVEGVKPPITFPVTMTEACESELNDLLNKLYVVAMRVMLVDYKESEIEIEQVGSTLEFEGHYTCTIQRTHVLKATSNSELLNNFDKHCSAMFQSFLTFEKATYGYMENDVLEISLPVEMMESYMHILEAEDKEIEQYHHNEVIK